MSMVTASSASTCTVESAWTVTEPLLTVRHNMGWLSQGAQPYHPLPEQILSPLLSHFQHSETQFPPQHKLEQGMVTENLSRTKT